MASLASYEMLSSNTAIKLTTPYKKFTRELGSLVWLSKNRVTKHYLENVYGLLALLLVKCCFTFSGCVF